MKRSVNYKSRKSRIGYTKSRRRFSGESAKSGTKHQRRNLHKKHKRDHTRKNRHVRKPTHGGELRYSDGFGNKGIAIFNAASKTQQDMNLTPITLADIYNSSTKKTDQYLCIDKSNFNSKTSNKYTFLGSVDKIEDKDLKVNTAGSTTCKYRYCIIKFTDSTNQFTFIRETKKGTSFIGDAFRSKLILPECSNPIGLAEYTTLFFTYGFREDVPMFEDKEAIKDSNP
jgi:hypothetical protein